MRLLLAILLVPALAGLALAVLALLARRADRAEWQRLAALQPRDPQHFTKAMVAGPPEPVRRYFTVSVRQGTPRLHVAEIAMAGHFGLGTRDDPRYQTIAVRQILAAPEGLVRVMRTTGGLPVSGSDPGLWTRFRSFGLVPVARAGGTRDHTRSAFGCDVSEAVIWSPAALLPGADARWTAVGDHTARVTIRRGDLAQTVELTADAEGRPEVVSFDRWSNSNPETAWRLQPLGAVPSDFRAGGGFCLPVHVEAGNMFGTDDWFPFFITDVTRIAFPKGQS